MIQKLRQILLTQYIGAIVTAILGAQCVQALLNLILTFIGHLLNLWRRPTGLIGELQPQDFDWRIAIYGLVNILLNAAVVWALMRWLFFGRQSSAFPEGAEPEPSAPETPSMNT